MFSKQKYRLQLAADDHQRAVQRKRAARLGYRLHRDSFLSRPYNLLFPFVAGVLVCASQLRNAPKGINRVPFMNLAKTGVGLYALISRLGNVRKSPEQPETTH